MTTALLTRCPHCGARFKLKDESAVGKKMKCRECETPFTVKPAKAAAAAPAKAKPKPKDPDTNGDDEFDDFGADEFGSGAAPPARLPPRRSTKKKPKRKAAASAPADEVPAPRPKPPANIGKMVRLGGGSMLGLGVLAGMWFVFFKPSPPMQPPASYGTFTHPKNAFSCEYPEGWEQSVASGEISSARWEKGDAKIYFRIGRGGGALADIAGIGSDPNEEEDETLTPEARLHEDPLFKNPAIEDYSDYEELSVATVQSGGRRVRLSEFKASGYHGFRGTTIMGRGAMRIICHCRESDWQVCKPIFERVIRSLGN